MFLFEQHIQKLAAFFEQRRQIEALRLEFQHSSLYLGLVEDV